MCKDGVEDEVHFFLHCQIYSELRSIEGLSDLVKLNKILNSENILVIQKTGKFLYSMWEKRKKKIQ
jgi:hypothetical protein